MLASTLIRRPVKWLMVLPRAPLLHSQKLLAAVKVSQIFYFCLTLSQLECAILRYRFHVPVEEDFFLLVSLPVQVISVCFESWKWCFEFWHWHTQWISGKRLIFPNIYTKNKSYILKVMSTLQCRLYPLRSAWLELQVCHLAVVYRL